MNHRREKHHDQTGIDPAAQKAHRGRSDPLAAALFSTAKTQAPFPNNFVWIGQSAHLASIPRPVKCSSAAQTAFFPGLFGISLIDIQEKLVQLFICQVTLAKVLFTFFFNTINWKRTTPTRASLLWGSFFVLNKSSNPRGYTHFPHSSCKKTSSLPSLFGVMLRSTPKRSAQ